MGKKDITKEIVIILFAAMILAVSYVYPNINSPSYFFLFFGGFLLILVTNIIVKKTVAYYLEADVKTKFWSIYHFGFKERDHFKKPLPMIWLTPLMSFISKGTLIWMPVLEFEITPRIERIAKRHELYRFAQMTEWHLALIVFGGIIANVVLYLILNMFGFRSLAPLSLYYAIWSILPLSNLDGSKLLFGSRKLWLVSGIIILSAFIWQSALF